MPVRGLRPYLLALLLPLSVLMLGLNFLHVRGPYWLGTNSDPAYVYLLNSLQILAGHSPTHLDHPGVTVHALGAIVIASQDVGTARSGPPIEEVLGDPERYLHAISRTLLVVYAVALFLAGVQVLTATGRLVLMWMVQATPFLSPSSFFELTDVKPEPLLYAVAALLMATLCGAFLIEPKHRTTPVVLLGVLTGIGVATKFTAASLVVIPLVCLRGARERATWAVTAAASFLFITVPAWTEWERSLSFVGRLVAGSGLYGQRLFAHELPYIDSLQRVLVEEIVFFATQALGLIVAVVVARDRKVREMAPLRQRALTLLWALLGTGAAQIALVLKHPYQPRYLLPALGLTGLTMALSAWLVCWNRTGHLDAAACAALAVFCASVAAIEAPRFLRRHAQVRDATACQSAAREAAEMASDCRRVSYYRGSSKPLALYQGDAWVNHAFAERLAGLYPHESFLAADRRLRDFKSLVEPSALSNGGCFVFQGSPGGPGRLYSRAPDAPRDSFPVGGTLTVRQSCPWEAVFEIRAR